MLRLYFSIRKILPFAVLGVLVAAAIYRLAWAVPTPIFGG